MELNLVTNRFNFNFKIQQSHKIRSVIAVS